MAAVAPAFGGIAAEAEDQACARAPGRSGGMWTPRSRSPEPAASFERLGARRQRARRRDLADREDQRGLGEEQDREDDQIEEDRDQEEQRRISAACRSVTPGASAAAGAVQRGSIASIV